MLSRLLLLSSFLVVCVFGYLCVFCGVVVGLVVEFM